MRFLSRHLPGSNNEPPLFLQRSAPDAGKDGSGHPAAWQLPGSEPPPVIVILLIPRRMLPNRNTAQRIWHGSLASLCATAANLFIGLLQVRLLLEWWGPATYAQWSVVLAAVAILGSLDYGQGVYSGNHFLRLAHRSVPRARMALSSAVWASIVLAFLELAGAALFFAVSPEIFDRSGSGLGTAGAAALLIHLLYWAMLGAPTGILGRLYLPSGFFSRLQWITTLQRLIGFACLLAAARGGLSLPAAVAIQCLGWASVQIWMLADLRRAFPDFYPWWRAGRIVEGWRSFTRSLPLTLTSLIQQFSSNGLILLAACFLSPVQVAVLAVMRTASNLFLQGSGILLNPLTPEFVRFRVQRKGQDLNHSLRGIWFAGTGATCLAVILVLPAVQPVFSAWTGRQLPWEPGLLALLLGAVAIRQWSSVLHSYLHANNRLYAQLAAELIRAGIAVGSVFLLVSGTGVEAFGWASLLAEGGCAIFLFWKTGQDIVRSGMRLEPGVWLTSTGQIACLAFALGGWWLFPPFHEGILAGILILFFLGWLAWKEMPQKLRDAVRHPLRQSQSPPPAVMEPDKEGI